MKVRISSAHCETPPKAPERIYAVTRQTSFAGDTLVHQSNQISVVSFLTDVRNQLVRPLPTCSGQP